MADNPFRDLPRVDAVATSHKLRALRVDPALAAEVAREAIAAARARIADGRDAPSFDRVCDDAAARVHGLLAPTLRPVINATGVVIHTNLGRAPLATKLLEGVAGYCNLEYDLAEGRRGSRRLHVETLATRLAGAEAALVVNNNAAAVVLMLAALAYGREVIISRGELVEIGGSFRIPDIMAASGARLVEVGTTNRTHARDYERAISEDTAAILRVHPSNYRIVGFTHRPETSELAAIARDRGLLLLHDLGSATFGPLPPELPHEARPAEELEAGVNVLCFSGDKLLGGPQAGILLGDRECIDRLASHPLARPFRADKLTLALLQQTLAAYLAGAPGRVIASRMLNATRHELRARAEQLRAALAPHGIEGEVVDSEDRVGGGSHPEASLAGAALSIDPGPMSLALVARKLRECDPPVVAVARDERLLVHLRSVPPDDEGALIKALIAVLKVP